MPNMKRFVLPCVLAAALAPLTAQETERPGSQQEVVRLNRAPVSTGKLQFKLPRPKEIKLKNGLTLMVLEDHRAPYFEINLRIDASDYSEPPELAGALADATASMLRLGTKTRTARQIAESRAELGAGGLGVNAMHDFVEIGVWDLTDNLDALLELFADVLLNPSFPQTELDNLKQNRLRDLRRLSALPQSLVASERVTELLYPNDRRRLLQPTEQAVQGLTRQHVIDYYNMYYRPSGGIIGVSGDVSSKEIVAKLEKALGGWKGSPAEAPKLPLEPPMQQKRIVLINRPNSTMTTLALANRAIGRNDPDYIACMLLREHLLRRLMRDIRGQKGYAYQASLSFSASSSANDLRVTTDVRTEVTGAALEEILKEFRDVRDRLTPAE